MRTTVVHVITKLELGGAQGNTLYTASHLDPARFDVVLAAGPGGVLDGKAGELAENPARPFMLRFIPALAREISPLKDLAAFFQLRNLLRGSKPLIVHTHSSKAGILGRLAAWLAGVPVIVHTYHGFGFHGRQHPLVRGIYVRLERLCCALSAWTIFVSEDNRNYAVRFGLARDGACGIIRSGVNLSELPAKIPDKGAKKAALGCGMHKPLVASVGNLKPQKNPEGFLRVAARCLKEAPESRYLFVGDGELRGRIESQLVAKGLHGKVFFPGWRGDVAEILAASDVFILTSLWEGLPRALVEAMKSGLPCVCYATDGVKDVLKDGVNGLLVEPGDEEGLSRGVLRLLREPQLASRLGAAAAASIGEEFDIDGMVRRQESLYDELLGKFRHGRS